jgi:hypothetical protein
MLLDGFPNPLVGVSAKPFSDVFSLDDTETSTGSNLLRMWFV